MRESSTIYDKEPFEREPKDLTRLEEVQAENHRTLKHLRYHLDQADSYMRLARDTLQEIENDNCPSWLEDAFLNLAASEKSNDDLCD